MKMKVRRTKVTKKQCQISHALSRAAQRLGYNLNKHHLDRMRGLIKRKEAEFLDKESLRISLWRLAIKGEDIVVAYDKQRKTIITILRNDDNNETDFQHEVRGDIKVDDITRPVSNGLEAVKQRLIYLYKQMAKITLPKCKECPLPLSCCSPEYCDLAFKTAKEWKEELETTNHAKLPLMGPNGCVARPHLRPLCTMYTCKINALGFEPNASKDWNEKYFNLRDRIRKLEITRRILINV